MSWLAQLGHVLAKDVRQARHLLLLYVAVVTFATVRAAGWVSAPEFLGASVVLLVVMTGMILVASVVQADSPTRTDAFWAVQPLRPSAVAGAKIGFALLAIVIGLAGQAIALRAYDVRGAVLPLLLARSAAQYGMCLLAAMVLAALMRDLRSFLLAVILIPVLTFGVFIGVAIGGPDAPGGLSLRDMLPALRVLVVLTGIALLGWLYRTRDSRLRTRMLGLIVAAVTFVTFGGSAPPRRDTRAYTGERIPLTLELPRGGLRTTGAGPSVVVRALAVPQGVRLVLEQGVVVLLLRDSTVLRLPVDDQLGQFGPASPTWPSVPGVRWLVGSGDAQFPSATTIRLPAEARRAARTGIARIEFEGRVVVVGMRTMTTMPLVAGSKVTDAGRRVRIASLTRELDEVRLSLRTSTAGGRGLPGELAAGWIGHGIQVALVNATRGEAVPLEPLGSSASLDGLVLPGASLESDEARHTWMGRSDMSESPRSSERVIDDDWLRDARVLVAEPVVRGSYPVHLQLAVP